MDRGLRAGLALIAGMSFGTGVREQIIDNPSGEPLQSDDAVLEEVVTQSRDKEFALMLVQAIKDTHSSPDLIRGTADLYRNFVERRYAAALLYDHLGDTSNAAAVGREFFLETPSLSDAEDMMQMLGLEISPQDYSMRREVQQKSVDGR